MPNRLEGLTETVKWRLMVEGAKRGALAQGYALDRVPGRGLSNIWDITKDGKTQRASIRTTRDRWFAFPPLAKGSKWKTLNEVEVVIVASVDSVDEPENVEVYIFPADEVRKCFDAAYAARVKAGQTVKDNFGMWISLEPDNRGLPVSAGSGLISQYKRVAIFPIPDLIVESDTGASSDDAESDEIEALASVETAAPVLTTIGEVMAWARERVASIAGVKVEAVKLDLKMEY